jgi:hypothetical protein
MNPVAETRVSGIERVARMRYRVNAPMRHY